MSVVDLVVLGMMLEEPMNAYQMVQLIEERQLTLLVKISKPAIYKSCNRLYKEGYLNAKPVRDSEMPEKVVYSVNATGRSHFHDLMLHYSSEIKPFHLEFNSFVWNLRNVDREEGLEMLGKLRTAFIDGLEWLTEHEREIQDKVSFELLAVVKQHRMVVATLVEWINETITEYRHLGKKS